MVAVVVVADIDFVLDVLLLLSGAFHLLLFHARGAGLHAPGGRAQLHHGFGYNHRGIRHHSRDRYIHRRSTDRFHTDRSKSCNQKKLRYWKMPKWVELLKCMFS